MRALYYIGVVYFVVGAGAIVATGFDTHVLTHSKFEGALLVLVDLVNARFLWRRARRTR